MIGLVVWEEGNPIWPPTDMYLCLVFHTGSNSLQLRQIGLLVLQWITQYYVYVLGSVG